MSTNFRTIQKIPHCSESGEKMGNSYPHFRYKILIINTFLKITHFTPQVGNFVKLAGTGHPFLYISSGK